MNSTLTARATHSREITQLADDLAIANRSRSIDSHEPGQEAALVETLGSLHAQLGELTKQIDRDPALEARQIESTYASARRRVTSQVIQVRDDLLVGLRVRIADTKRQARAQSDQTTPTTVAHSQEVLAHCAQEISAIRSLMSENPPISGTALDQARLYGLQATQTVEDAHTKLDADPRRERNALRYAGDVEVRIRGKVEEAAQKQAQTAVQWFEDTREALMLRQLRRRTTIGHLIMLIPFAVTALAFIWAHQNSVESPWWIIVLGVVWGALGYWIRSKAPKKGSLGWSAGGVALAAGATALLYLVLPLLIGMALIALTIGAIALVVGVIAWFRD